MGHTQVQTTARYAHLANDSIKAAAGKVSDSIGKAIWGGGIGNPFMRRISALYSAKDMEIGGAYLTMLHEPNTLFL